MPVLDKQFNQVVQYMGGRVPFRLTTSDYADFADMKRDWLATGRIKVNVHHSAGTIFGAEFMNYYFRAWHDYCHIMADADFSQDGERKAAEEMKRSLRELLPDLSADLLSRFDAIIDEEVIGQGEYYVEHGDFPTDQYQFAVNYLAGKQVAA